MKKVKKNDRWRLDTSALNQQFNEFRKASSPLFDRNVPYDTRHTGATIQHKRAADFGLNGQAIALYDNHDYNTALLWYIAPLFEEVEIVCRFGNELIEFCEKMIAYSLAQHEQYPWQFRHKAAAESWMQLLGRTQLREQIKAYRARTFDLPDLEIIEKVLKKHIRPTSELKGDVTSLRNVWSHVFKEDGLAGAYALPRRPR